jgi:allantoinase
VRNWAVRDYGNRIGIWPLMEVLTRYGIGANAALNTEVCDHHPEMIEEGGKLGWEWIGHNQTKALRLTEMVLAKLPKARRSWWPRPVTGWRG